MKQNEIKKAVEKIRLPDDAAMRIECACRATNIDEQPRPFRARTGMRILIVAACVLALSVGVYATARLVGFYMERNGDTVNIGATLGRENLDESESPIRAWNANEDEIMVKLVFGYMPEDIKPGKENGKYGGADNTRAMTFSGFDLRICDLDAVIGNIGTVEEFVAGSNSAFLVTSDSEISLYNKSLYVLLEDEHMVIKAKVACGITDDEIKAIAAGLSIEETDDITLAIPISNEVGLGATQDVPFVISTGNTEISREDLLAIGDSAHYTGYTDEYNITVNKVEIMDGISSLDINCFYDGVLDKYGITLDDAGNFLPYGRTEVDYESGKFGDTVQMTKKLVVVTVELTGGTTAEVDAEYAKLTFLQDFRLERLKYGEDGSISGGAKSYVVDRTPQKWATFSSPIYREKTGDSTYRIAYIIDEDQLDGELLFESYYAKIYYSFASSDFTK